jgi:hypothetical protein
VDFPDSGGQSSGPGLRAGRACMQSCTGLVTFGTSGDRTRGHHQALDSIGPLDALIGLLDCVVACAERD